MRRSRRPSTLIRLVALATLAAAAAGHFAPLNPAFVAYQHRVETAGPQAASGSLVPAPVNTRPWTKAALPLGPLALGSSYDPTYDLRNAGRVTPVRNQYQFNVCWVFASLASLESSLLPADPQDLSEDNLAVAAGTEFDTGLYNPGNYCMTTAELARWNGPVTESAEPYGSGTFVSGLTPLAHVQNVLFLPDRTGYTGDANETIKWAVETYGAVYSGIYADTGMSSSSTSAYYDPATSAYYYNGASGADHAVDIVGWDDDYDPANFSSTPSDKGAFIVRNSWGSSWGDGGYFYVSYDDVQIGKGMAVFTGDSTTTYAQNLGYDRLGLTDKYGFTDSYGNPSDTAWMAAAFTTKGDTPLEAASFYAQSPGTTYDIYAASDLNDKSTWTELASGTISVPGYRTLPFTAAQPIEKAGVRFFLIVGLTTPDTDYPIPLEDAEPYYSSRATSAAGDSFVSADGSAGNWTDIGALGADVCLKAFAGAAAADPVRPVTRALAASVKRGRYVSLHYRVIDKPQNDCEKVTVKIRNRAGHVVKTLALGTKAANVALTARYRCLLARGSYRFYVYATDRWGNTQSSLGHATLTVK
jgi:C1A family cysteine protease